MNNTAKRYFIQRNTQGDGGLSCSVMDRQTLFLGKPSAVFTASSVFPEFRCWLYIAVRGQWSATVVTR